ncbi:MAG: 50S ribosomal protein L22 [Candidatus Omnitrophica bacterium]|nr:50S ribosomal protein L22 [Candidatus Omnitrophota bacterium]
MVAKALTKYLRISPQKLRQVIDLVKRRTLPEAQAILHSLNKKGAKFVNKTLSSAVANAKQKGYDEAQLKLLTLRVNDGPMITRYRAASFGRATMIRRRTSHLLVELGSAEILGQKTKQKPKKTTVKKKKTK